MVTIRPPARVVGEPKKTKKGRKEERHPNSGKLAIRRGFAQTTHVVGSK